MCLEIINLIYMYKKDLALNNLQWLICHKIKHNQTKNVFGFFCWVGFLRVYGDFFPVFKFF